MSRSGAASDTATARVSFLFATGASFILLAAILASQAAAEGIGLLVRIRAAVLADFLAGLPIGRQALVSSCRLLPLPSFAALPFTPFLPAHGYGYACRYGTALVVALNTLPLAGLLRRWPRMPAWGALPAALLLQAAGAAWLGAAGAEDLLACLALLATARFLEGETAIARRALSGVFYGLALLTHPAGLAAAGLRLLAMAARHVGRRRAGAGQRAVDFTRLASVTYCAAILLFLNWMIMRDPFYPLRHAHRGIPREGEVAPALRELEQALDGPLAAFMPVASGHWSHLARPLLAARRGTGFIDFHPDKLHAGEPRSPLLIVPRADTPLFALADVTRVPGALLLTQTPRWRFYLVPRPAVAAGGGSSGVLEF